MMKDYNNTYDLYSPMPEHTIVEFISKIPNIENSSQPCNRVVLRQLNTGETTTIEVSFCAILIGFRPDLSFLSPLTKYTPNEQNCDEIDEKTKLMEAEKDYHLFSLPAFYYLSRRISWLKYLCAKCKHLSLCERSRRYDTNRKTSSQQQLQQQRLLTCCECIKTNSPDNSLNSNNTTINSDSNNNNSLNSKCKKLNQIESCDSQMENPVNQSITEHQLRIGEDTSKPIDCKTNPIAVDHFTNEVLHVPFKGLYALGPLVGDNFIRFIAGGALAVTSALHKQR